MSQKLIKTAFTKEEIEKYSGLLSFLKLTGVKKLVVFVAGLIKKIATWVLITFGITTVSGLYEKVKENPMSILEEENREWKFWRQSEGPFENVFRIATYAMPAFGGLWGGGIGLVLDKLLDKHGYGLESLGKYLDKKLNLKAGDNVKLDDSLDNALLELFTSEPKENKNDTIKDLIKSF